MSMDEYPVYDGAHEGIISDELWQLAQEKRQQMGTDGILTDMEVYGKIKRWQTDFLAA